jgi:uncharacterized membrane protein
MTVIRDILILGVTLLVLDGIYLYNIKNYFMKQIESVQFSPIKINYAGAALCYVFLIFGLYYFIIREKRSLMDAFLLGIVIYGVYETTSIALLKKWKWQTVFMDTLWGGILFALTTAILYYIKNKKI